MVVCRCWPKQRPPPSWTLRTRSTSGRSRRRRARRWPRRCASHSAPPPHAPHWRWQTSIRQGACELCFSYSLMRKSTYTQMRAFFTAAACTHVHVHAFECTHFFFRTNYLYYYTRGEKYMCSALIYVRLCMLKCTHLIAYLFTRGA